MQQIGGAMNRIALFRFGSIYLVYLTVTVASIACGHVDDNVPDASQRTDANDQPRCDASQPFGTPMLISGLNSDVTDWNAQLTADELLIFFSSNRFGSAGFDIYWAKRATRNESFTPPVRLTSIDTAADERTPAPTADGLTLYFFRNDDIYVTTRVSRDVDFGTSNPVSAVNTAASENDTYVTVSGLYFNRAISSDGSALFRSRRLPSGDLAAPETITELSLAHTYAGHPVLSIDEMRILFYSTRSDGGNVGYADIWTASRTTSTGIFGSQTDLISLNSIAQDAPNWLSPDGCVLYLQSNRSGGIGDFDLYMAERSK